MFSDSTVGAFLISIPFVDLRSTKIMISYFDFFISFVKRLVSGLCYWLKKPAILFNQTVIS